MVLSYSFLVWLEWRERQQVRRRRPRRRRFPPRPDRRRRACPTSIASSPTGCGKPASAHPSARSRPCAVIHFPSDKAVLTDYYQYVTLSISRRRRGGRVSTRPPLSPTDALQDTKRRRHDCCVRFRCGSLAHVIMHETPIRRTSRVVELWLASRALESAHTST